MDTHTQKVIFDFAIFLFSLTICAVFSFIETSLTAMRLFKIKELEQSTKKYKYLFRMLENKPQFVLITIVIATNMACITTAVLLQNIIENVFADLNLPQGLGFTLGIAAGTIIVSLLGEIIPKSIAQAKSTMTSSLLWLTNIIFSILSPVAPPLFAISRYFSQIKGDTYDQQTISEKEIHFLINYVEKKGTMDHEKINMLQNIFRMSNTHVKEILIPNNNIISVDIKSDVDSILNLFADYKYSRFPVYDQNPENIIGIIYQKDLFLNLQLYKEDFNIKKLIKPIIFVPDSLRVNELLKEFKKTSIHMAMVLDEYGSTIGLVTLEDALEEIVGEIKDEHDPLQNPIKICTIKEDQEWSVDATFDLDRLAEYLQIEFEVKTAVTLGGFLTEQMQHLPAKGERIFYKNYCFTIEKADKKRIYMVHIKKSESQESCNPDKEEC